MSVESVYSVETDIQYKYRNQYPGIISQLYCNSHSSLVSNLPVASDGSENVTGLDLSDFPALADRSRREGTGNPTPVLNPLAGRAPYGRPLVWRKGLIVPKLKAVCSFWREEEYPLIITSRLHVNTY